MTAKKSTRNTYPDIVAAPSFSCNWRPSAAAAGKARLQAGEQILFGLQSNRKPHKSVVDAGRGAGLLAHVRVGHRRWMGDEAFDARSEEHTSELQSPMRTSY